MCAENKTPLLLTKNDFMSQELELSLIRLLSSQDCTIEPGRSKTSKELMVHSKGRYFYISRKTGIKKGELVVVADPSNAQKLDTLVGELDGISIRNGKCGRYISSSNYNKFRNKGELDGSNEHFGAAYTLDINSTLESVGSFFSM